ncbi:MAG: hypothetical protein GX786_04895, partial [Clostridiales bacterium]|nr:hypothetical protein [Clostridiales bacterium]
ENVIKQIEESLLDEGFALKSEVDAYLQEGNTNHIASTWVYRVSL